MYTRRDALMGTFKLAISVITGTCALGLVYFEVLIDALSLSLPISIHPSSPPLTVESEVQLSKS